MSDSTKAALAASVAAGYLLGRRRNTKLAMALATYLASKKLKAKPQDLLGASPQVAQLVEQLRKEVLSVGRQALKTAADRRLSGFADSLADRTKSLNGLLDAVTPGGGEEEEEEGEGPSGEEGENQGEGPSGKESGERPARPRRPRREEAGEAPAASGKKAAKTAGSAAKKAPAKKASAKKAAKKSAARKAPAESSTRRR